MKNTLKIAFLIIIILSVNSKSAVCSNPASDKIFVGYINEYPIFDAIAEKTLYVLKDKLEMLTKYPINYSVVAVNDSYICYSEKKNKGYNVVFVTNKIEKRYPIPTDLGYATLNKDGILYYTDTKARNEIKSISVDGQTKDVGIKGYVAAEINGNLYYLKEHDKNIEGANADIFVTDIKSLGKSQKLVNNVSGESIVILPDQMFIYDRLLSGGEYRPMIYSIKDKKYTLLKIGKEYWDAKPYYSYQKKCMVFYKSETLELKFVEISTTVDAMR